ncbi:MAG: hypothetical protein COZ06_35395 [Armatimonadetes bacterium CG_4_10_14_3_um_filter_66_18]|nr:hypothetical protein [Armatimonadota bacterium]PIU94242.1 MAG: hypothetical protein COS65_08715 [Armatimonadetes bacterium CG06_land_8_20_14_3_00_66_21]PIY36644.1 MAG: hypothetical protein COZ06_35395 [Armatimonadetes bacterium CG_4_10_14_3_um_filter_66_18]
MTDLYRRKSVLSVEADRLKAVGSRSGAHAVYAEAAELDQQLAQALRAQGDPDFYINAFSAASCWLEAEQHSAAAAALRQLAAAELPEAVRAEVERTLDMVCTKREPACAVRFLSRLPETAICSIPGSGNG